MKVGKCLTKITDINKGVSLVLINTNAGKTLFNLCSDSLYSEERPYKEALDAILKKLANTNEYGSILRAKGMLPANDGTWMYFDLVPGEYEIREGKPDFTGRICVIGSKLAEDKLKELFGVN